MKLWYVFLKIIETNGWGIANFSLLCFLAFKFATNHLKHIQDNIELNGKKLDVIVKKVDSNTERISFLEGKTE